MKILALSVYQSTIAILLGILLTLSFAPFNVFPLAILAPTGLLLLIRPAKKRQSVWLGFLFGLGFFSTGVYWIYISVHNFGNLPVLPALAITGGLIVFLALFTAFTCYLYKHFFSYESGWNVLGAFSVIWVALEWMRSWIFTGFPWLFLGYSQINSPLRGYAPIFSVYGVSLTVLISSGLVFFVITQFRAKNYRLVYFNLLAIVMLWGVGSILNLIHWTSPKGDPLSVSLVQGNIPQSVKWSPEHVELSLNRYAELSEPLWGKSQIIVWPEAAIPLPLETAAEFIQVMSDRAESTNTVLLTGIPIQAKNKNGYYNAIIMLGKDKQVYLKKRLVPFGEYVPLQHLFANLFGFMDIPMSNMIPGKLDQSMITIAGQKVLVTICYEIAFPELINNNDKNIGIILTVTNDAWFGDSSAQAQHLQIAQMRALELGRPVLFGSNDGITAIINASGDIEAVAPAHEAFVLTGDIQPMTGRTPWMTFGSDPIFLVLLILICAAIFYNRKQKVNDETDQA